MNAFITATEMRVMGPDGENFGVLPREEALAKAREFGLDLVEISPNATPPVVKIIEYGKYLYEQAKKARENKAKSHQTETKSVQVKIGTSEHSMGIKAKQASEWLAEGHRVRFELYLQGRAKYLDKTFLKERMERFLKFITVDFKIAEPVKQAPKGMSMVLEKR
jgi:translation initiation factor IF-3